MIVVGIQRPYYPDMRFFEDKDWDAAKSTYDTLLEQENEENGKYNSVVFIGKVLEIQKIKTDY